ncbi:MAG TPA: signal peptidase I [Pseudomonadales bacterium]|nr:signal peptidase I [Pseudomonadales bacterium]
MPSAVPPPLQEPSQVAMSRRIKLIIGVSLIPLCCFVALLVLRLFGLVRPFYIPTGAMIPAACPEDHVMMENVTFHLREPRRGDIVVFKTDGIASIPPPSTHYLKRVAGEPGDHLVILDGNLFINDKQVLLSNVAGKISYDNPPGIWAMQTNVIVPRGCYYVLGDNSTNSADSRFFGSIPRGNIIGRIVFCYWPPERTGGVK